jgi:hypothetical protein
MPYDVIIIGGGPSNPAGGAVFSGAMPPNPIGEPAERLNLMRRGDLPPGLTEALALRVG